MPADAPRWKLAASLEDMRAGEVMMLSSRGEVLGPKAQRWATLKSWGSVVGMGVLGGAAAGMIVSSVAVGVVAALGFTGATAWQARFGPTIKRALALASAGRRDEARAVVEALESKRPPAHYQPTIDYLMGKLLWQDGRFEAAQERYARAIAAQETSKHFEREGMYWICAFDRAQLWAVMGQLEETLAARPRLDEAPSGDYFFMERILTDLLIAFYSDSTERLPMIEELYEWSKAALRTNRFGLTLALLAWVFERQGDVEMAAHVLSEVPPRLGGDYLEQTAPRVHAWLSTRLEDESATP